MGIAGGVGSASHDGDRKGDVGAADGEVLKMELQSGLESAARIAFSA
jgi:hypothetical protein